MRGRRSEFGDRRETERGACAVVASICAVCLGVLAAGWLLYVACQRWPLIAGDLQTGGWMLLSVGMAAVLLLENRHGDA